eukprot:COSAG05_NODE_69_length_22151_cov_124.775258_7_plen_110_part_00
MLKVHLITFTTPLTVLPGVIHSFRPYISLKPPQHHHMAAQLGPGNDPVHTLFDEQGNELPVEVDDQEQESADGDSNQEEVEDITVRDNRKKGTQSQTREHCLHPRLEAP